MRASAAPGRAAALRKLALTGLVLGGLAVLARSPLRELLHPAGMERAQHWLAALRGLGPLAFVGLLAAAIGVGAPRLPLAALGGLSFGWFEGSVLATLGTLLGCYGSFALARWLARELLPEFGAGAEGLRRQWLERLRRRPIATVALLRLLPLGPSLIANGVLAALPLSSRDFLLGTALGTLPETLVCALLADGVGRDSLTSLVVGTALLTGTLALSLVFDGGRAARASLPENPRD